MAYSFFLKVYGCQMNDYDGQRIADLLKSSGYEQIISPEDADVLVYYTCNIREKAVHKLRSAIGMMRSRRTKVIVVGGCVAQAEGEGIFSKIPGVDISIGPQTYHKLPQYIDEVICGKKRKILDMEFYKLEKFNHMARQKVSISEYVPIQEGCDNFCTYCVVPYTRGREYSRPAKDIIDEVKFLVENGAQEIVLGGQNVNSYHGLAPYVVIGQPKTSWRIERLLQEVSLIPGIKRLRYLTAHPKDFNEELMRVHSEIPMLVPFVHIPVQSGSNRILKMMNRRHTAEEYLDKLARFRDICPNIQFSSDFIVGFPGEEEEDFQNTVDLVKKARYTLSFSFKYSVRANTPAASMPDQIPENTKKERLERLHQALLADQRHFNQALVGKRQEILFVKKGKKPGQYIGKNVCLQSVIVNDDRNIIGEFHDVLIERAEDNCVFGRLV